MNEIKNLTEKVLKFRNDRNWGQFHNKKDMILSLVLEASELLELTQWKSEEEFMASFNQDKSKASDEIADIFYWVLLLANDLGLDLNSILTKKLKKNELKYPVDKAIDSSKKYKDL